MLSKAVYLKKIKVFLGLEMSDENSDPTLWLTRAYIVAFFLIGLLTVISHQMVSTLTQRQIEGKEISYLIGEESSLMRDISYYATSYYKENEKFDKFYFTRAVANLKDSELRIAEYLENTSYSNRAKDSLYRNMREKPIELDIKIRKFLDTADKFLAYSSYVGSKEKDAAVAEMRISAVEVLPKLLDKALSDYQSAQIEEMMYLSDIESYAAYGVIIVIILEALLIFRPLANNVGLLHRSILKQAMEDMLTGLKNRRAFMQETERYQKTALREKKPYAVAICDLDKFKNVNDTYGHDVGDVVLKHFSNLLQKTLRPSDIIARLGGEEFAIVLTNVDSKKGTAMLERVREVVEKTPCFYHGPNSRNHLRYTVSIGVVFVAQGEIGEIGKYLKRADEGLYDAKSTGRNKVVSVKFVAEPTPQDATA